MAKKTGEKYQNIIEAAVKVIAQHGYHQAQVSKIAREASVADGTIYLYFDNKADVLVSLFKEKMGAFVQATRERIELLERADDRLRELIYMHLWQMSQNRDWAIVTQIELRQSDPVVRAGINQALKEYLKLIDEVIFLGKEQGVFRENVEHRVARKMIFGTLDEAVTSWVMNDRKYNLVSLVEPIHNLFINGLKVEKQ
ncbi:MULTISPECIES: TetR/AcrR family transcriptional regulator [Aneurinibacillus]|uniref:TetR family transcriptional regulator n=1 Tax=Aneurinibacillus thermoaerophilus TaxID=143495 RepID=A0A1G8EHA3_ANETH|nr:MULTISPECIES: TetR/AcrR family transcriptional regulator [Aneurinibacillus]AMA72046.1 TetR family transcriptional regulator [Aneurinibacillus sp. XH2]MED0681408.1 TetR/AcrR family transcriptional regulator [Aneurinibacillus thermoaerophilus]MED0736386.1 TetR/AcrR family transcriptional regulator [Aneurinibacillus thermoaerophilus]MED0755880.1 TetR/AcrR family transcriptional regulator [Aneurinibacillus thermoaerophilus]MED0759796.1 TetR/AcrR family transcriptional regulator [Aneurinibacillu